MKVGAVRSAKFRLLKMRLGLPEWQVVGILQSLWLFASSSAIHGDIGRYADDEIAAALDMDAAMFSQVLAALIETRWVDEDQERRLVIHDWRDHREQWVARAAEKKEWVPSCYQKGGLASSKLAKASLGIAEDSHPILSLPCLSSPIGRSASSCTEGLEDDSATNRPTDRGLTPWAEMAVATLTANLALSDADAARQRKALAAVARRMDALDCRDSLLRELAAQAVAVRSGRRTRKPVAMWQSVANEILATAEAKAKGETNGKAH